jgi:hypothetical protein
MDGGVGGGPTTDLVAPGPCARRPHRHILVSHVAGSWCPLGHLRAGLLAGGDTSSAWTGAKALEADDQAAGEPYAAAFDGQLYAYSASADGVPYYNVFTEGEGWAGWEAYPADLPATVEYQPSVSVYDDAQHVVYTADDGHAYYTSYDGSAWSDWADLGENYAYEPILYAYGDEYYLTYTGADGSLYYKTYDAAARDEPEDDGY